MAVGDSQGYVTILAVDQELAVPKQDDFDKILDLLQQNKWNIKNFLIVQLKHSQFKLENKVMTVNKLID